MTAEEPQAPKAPPKARALRPRDAATLIIVDSSSGEPRVLLGRRRLDMVFMPGRYVFPGGRVDPADKLVDVEDDLAQRELERLMVAMKGTRSVARARSLALAAVRETFEEAGLLIGTPLGEGAVPNVPNWKEFFATGYRPALSRLTFFSRAISTYLSTSGVGSKTAATPGPSSPRKYDSSAIPSVSMRSKLSDISGYALWLGAGRDSLLLGRIRTLFAVGWPAGGEEKDCTQDAAVNRAAPPGRSERTGARRALAEIAERPAQQESDKDGQIGINGKVTEMLHAAILNRVDMLAVLRYTTI